MTADDRGDGASGEGGIPAVDVPAESAGGRRAFRRMARSSVTRDLMVAAALAAIGAVLLTLVAPITTALAATAPPAYAVVAGIHSVLPYLARRLLAMPFAASLVGGIVGVLSFASTPLGPLILVSLLAATVPFDVVLNVCSRFAPALRLRHYLLAAITSAVVLFFVSLPVFSPQHLTVWMLVAVLAGRLLGQCGAVWISALIAAGLRRAGIRRGSALSP